MCVYEDKSYIYVVIKLI